MAVSASFEPPVQAKHAGVDATRHPILLNDDGTGVNRTLQRGRPECLYA